ncbi:MAG: UDP-2,3-diacylglucosamine diphosphatase [Bacteroidota bacterium]
MYLFLSDLHLGRGTDAESRAAERDAIAVLGAHEDAVREGTERGGGGLFLVGDVFNQFIEYGTLVPKGFVRLQGALAAWTDGGLPATYLVGNRDPWHLDYFETELGVRVLGDLAVRLGPYEAYLTHGDGLVASDWGYNLAKPVLRNRLAYWLYRSLPPGDWGFRLARWYALRGDGAPEDPFVRDLRASARRHLATTSADLVVHGHTHQAELSAWPEGTYLNPGYFFAERTFARLDAGGLALLRWTGAEAEVLARTEHRAGPV